MRAPRRDPASGAKTVRVRLFYQTLDQARGLTAAENPPISLAAKLCGPRGACSAARLAAQ